MESSRLNELIERFYRERRDALQEAADERRARLHAQHPELAAAEEKLALAGLEQMRTVLAESEAADTVAKTNYAAAAEALERLLSQLGLSRDYATAAPYCVRCADSGSFDGRPCPDCYPAVLAAVLDNSGEADPLGGGSFEKFNLLLFDDADADPNAAESSPRRFSTRQRMTRLCQEMERYADQFAVAAKENEMPARRNLLFSGPPGTGKTYLASCLAKALRAHQCSVASFSMPQFMQIFGEYRVLGKSFNPDPQRLERLGALLEQVEYSDFLILDDLGTEALDANSEGDLLNLLNQRERSGRPLLISTNLGLKELKARYDGRVFSRFLGGFRMFSFSGKDLRARRGD